MKKEITYSIRCVPRYTVTRFCYEECDDGLTGGGSEGKGEFANFLAAHEIATALAKAESDGATNVIGPEPLTKPKRGSMFLSEGEHAELVRHGYEEADLLRVSEANQYTKMAEELRAMVAQDVRRRLEPRG